MPSASDDLRPEFSFINWVSKQAANRKEIQLGIGDDAAILSAAGRDWVTTVDVITSGVHFESDLPPELIGRKALAVNISDMAAMAAEPCAAFIGIVFPRTFSRENAERLYQGIFELAREWNVSIAGGDTNSWDGPLVISVTLSGLVEPGRAVRRDGAQAGDWIFVTGALGGSLPSRRHLTFTPRVKEANALRQRVDLHAMLDLSDGVGSDLFHILDRSGVGAKIDGDAVPIHADVPASLKPEERLRRALGDGEDFELLFCVSPEDGRRLLEEPPFGTPLTKIGEIVAGSGATLHFQGTTSPLLRSGWSHAFG
ncbi:thiamine-phosphate kinase [Planctomicrobium sp. SH661]|uniref:thiamine-phosphate kinase n=1 Tax=Planctomicrobium sp. SH661 TaxID=3448124 RepID=UPI003F5AF4B1